MQQIRDIFSGFEEQGYLNANPDIRDAVAAGSCRPALSTTAAGAATNGAPERPPLR